MTVVFNGCCTITTHGRFGDPPRQFWRIRHGDGWAVFPTDRTAEAWELHQQGHATLDAIREGVELQDP